jgi:hypothetical protein
VDSVRTIQVYLLCCQEGGARRLQKLFNTFGLEADEVRESCGCPQESHCEILLTQP